MSLQTTPSTCSEVSIQHHNSSSTPAALAKPDSENVAFQGNPEQPSTTEVDAFLNVILDVVRHLVAKQSEPAAAVA